ncbi:MAG: type VII secretion target [Streptosporangiaceae bacterium]
MDASAGGGSISVEPASLDALSARISGVAGSTASARGGLGRAASATAGCQEPAAGSFTRLQTLLSGAMQCLDDCSLALAKAVSQAAAAYVTTDATQMSAGGRAAPR